MARGWESKSVESQQADREQRAHSGPELTGEERVKRARRRTAELALLRARADLAVATAPGHRAMLGRAIATLEAHLRDEFGVDPATVQ
jgi:hypothetical protein